MMRKSLHLVWGFVLGSFAFPSSLGWANVNSTLDLPPDLGQFRNTYYYVALESAFGDGPLNAMILSLSGDVLARVSKGFKAALDIEGTGKLRDNRVVNYAGRKNGEIRYRFSSHDYGEGVGNCELVPFHTIAVDSRRVALGSTVQIDETVGMVLPDGSVHNGIWRADDVGSAIQKDRVDLFVGTADRAFVLEQNGITHLKPLTIRLLAPPADNSCVHDNPVEPPSRPTL